MDYPTLTPRQMAQTLRGWRKTRNLTQREAGDRVGLLPKTISALEANPEQSTIGSLFKLLSALDLELVVKPKSNHDGVPPATGEW